MKVEVYDYDGLGCIIDPESDTKLRAVILIGKQTVKCNPRQAVIYISSERVDKDFTGIESLKQYCAEQKQVFVCPKDASIATLEATYKYLFKNHLDLNIIRDQMVISAAGQADMAAAEAFREYLLDEYDVETGEITVLSF